MKQYHPDAELAPRDVVARAIDSEMKRLGLDCVYLDVSHRPASYIRERFPNIYKRCLSYAYDLTERPIPVVPAAHYMCGGVVTDLDGRYRIDVELGGLDMRMMIDTGVVDRHDRIGVELDPFIFDRLRQALVEVVFTDEKDWGREQWQKWIEQQSPK